MTRVFISVFAQLDLKFATIELIDGANTKVVVKLGEGNLTWTERRNIEYTLDGGALSEVREGDEAPVDVRLDAVWESITGSTSPVPIIKGLDSYVSSDTDACRPYACDIVVTYDPNCAGGGAKITLADFRWEQVDFDMRAGTFSFTGKCNIKAATVEAYS
jgi:hypothetical protein